MTRKHLALMLMLPPFFFTTLRGEKLTPKNTAVIVIDVQEDFTQPNSYKKEMDENGKPVNGRLAVADTGDDYVQAVREATKKLKDMKFKIFATQDWHPKGHISFASNHKGKNPFDRIPLKGAPGNMQTLWPDHCVQNTDGARILLPLPWFTEVIKKGQDLKHDSYSGFADDGGKETALKDILKSYKIKNLIIDGIATDYCVLNTVLHALKRGFNVYVIKSLCRGVDAQPGDIKAAWQKMEDKGAILVDNLDDLIKNYIK